MASGMDLNEGLVRPTAAPAKLGPLGLTLPTVTVTVTAPDGTTSTPTATKTERVALPSGVAHNWHVGDVWLIYAAITDTTKEEELVGIYEARVKLTQINKWHASWVSTGSYEAARPTSITVEPN